MFSVDSTSHNRGFDPDFGYVWNLQIKSLLTVTAFSNRADGGGVIGINIGYLVSIIIAIEIFTDFAKDWRKCQILLLTEF